MIQNEDTYKCNFLLKTGFNSSMAEEHDPKLEPLGLTSEMDHPPIGRRIEAMSRRQIFSTVTIYGVCSVLILLALIFGPSYYVSQSMRFQPELSTASSTRRYKFDFYGLHFFNDFLTCELILNKKSAQIPEEYKAGFNISLYFISTMTLGSRTVSEINQPIQHVAVTFPDGEESQRIRVFSTGIVKFDKLKGYVTIKFPQHVILGGEFVWIFADPAHSLVQLFLRIIFFIIGIIVFIRLLLSDFDFHHSHIGMRLMFVLDILLVVGSDPFYILTYFSDSYIIKLYDCIVSIFLLISVAFTAFAVLLMTGLIHRDITFIWILIRFIPFLIAFLVFASSSGYAVLRVDKDPISKLNIVTKILDIIRMSLIGVYAICLIYGGIVFHSDVPDEKPAFIVMSILFFCVTLTSELMNTLEPFLGSDFAIQIFSLFSSAVYILFFNFLNWPIDSSMINRKEVDTTDATYKDQIKQVLSPTVAEI